MNSPYEELANAIITRAVKDWRSARRKLKKNPNNREAIDELKDCENFIRSKWFGLLSDLDGELLMQKLYEEMR